jgi:hypothetical protein
VAITKTAENKLVRGWIGLLKILLSNKERKTFVKKFGRILNGLKKEIGEGADLFMF